MGRSGQNSSQDGSGTDPFLNRRVLFKTNSVFFHLVEAQKVNLPISKNQSGQHVSQDGARTEPFWNRRVQAVEPLESIRPTFFPRGSWDRPLLEPKCTPRNRFLFFSGRQGAQHFKLPNLWVRSGQIASQEDPGTGPFFNRMVLFKTNCVFSWSGGGPKS